MSLILHIFKKDARHFWPEILISLALVIAFVGITIEEWSRPSFASYTTILGLLTLLVPVSWWILIARLVHDESLIGENQFWITRPYQWQQLLAAKALSLLVFLYLPLFLAQVILLAAAGFSPLSHLAGLLYNLLLVTGFLVIPIAAIATITSNFARFAITLLGGVVYLALLLCAAIRIPASSSTFPNPYANSLSFALLLGACLVAIVLQYASRLVCRSRILLLSLPILAIVLWFAWPIGALAHHIYPPSTSGRSAPVQLTFDPDPTRQEDGTMKTPQASRSTLLTLPLLVSGIPSGKVVRTEAVRISIDGPNGLHWTSPWRGFRGDYLPATTRSSIQLLVDRAFYEKAKSVSVTAHVLFAQVELQAGSTTTILAGEQDASVPGGTCSTGIFGNWPLCRFALRPPPLTYVTTRFSRASCLKSQPYPGIVASAWIGTLDSDPAEFGINSVKTVPIQFSNQFDSGSRLICPGTPITFTSYTVLHRSQSETVIPNLNLSSYARVFTAPQSN